MTIAIGPPTNLPVSGTECLVFGDTGYGAGGAGSIVPWDLVDYANDAVTVVNTGVMAVQSFTQGGEGSVERTPGDANVLRYTHTGLGTGTDTFTYVATDGLGNEKTATVTVTIQ